MRNDPNFGGIAWHGYGGDVNLQTQIHNQYPNVNAYMTEHSGGTWIANQQAEDMNNLIDYTRNWDKSWVKWGMALDENHLSVRRCRLQHLHRSGHRAPQRQPRAVRSTKTVEYYTMGHLTKFVKPGALRIDSTANGSVKNVAWKNPDGSKALIAYNTTGSSQSVRVNWGSQSFIYTLPTKTSATFTWAGTQGGGGGTGTAITGLAGKCVDVAGANSADGTGGAAVRLQRYGGAAVDPAGRRHDPGPGQVPRRERRLGRRRSEGAAVFVQRQCGAAMDLFEWERSGESAGEQVS